MQINKLIPILILVVFLCGCVGEEIKDYDYNLQYNDREKPIYPSVGQSINITLIKHTGYSLTPSLYDHNVLLLDDIIDWTTNINGENFNVKSFIYIAIQKGETIINIEETSLLTDAQVDMFSIYVRVTGE